MKVKHLLIGLFVILSSSANAQQDEQMSMYLYNKLYLNPAYAGSRDALSAIAVARFQWVSFKGAPTTQWVSIHAPLMQKTLGVGAHLVNDQIGSRTRTSVFGDLSASIPLNKNKQRLAVGLSAGADFLGYDFSDLNANDPDDVIYTTRLNETKFNMGAGIYYYADQFYVSLSSPRLLEAKPKNLDTVLTTLNSRHYFLSGGYVFNLNSIYKLQPATLIKYTPEAPITIDLNLNLIIHDIVSTGISYRFNESMGINALVNIKKTFSVGYMYDFPINGLRTYQNGSHEIFLRYDFRPKKSVYTSPRYF